MNIGGASASDLEQWPQHSLDYHVQRVIEEGAVVRSVEAWNVGGAGALHGVIIGRYAHEGYEYDRWLPVFERAGEELVASGIGLGGTLRARLVGVIDRSGGGALALLPQGPAADRARLAGPGGGWTVGDVPSEAQEPVLVFQLTYDGSAGSTYDDLVLYDLSNPEQPQQLARMRSGWTAPTSRPGRRQPPRRIRATEPTRLVVMQKPSGPRLLLHERDLTTPAHRCREPVERVRVFEWRVQDGVGRWWEDFDQRVEKSC